MAGERTPMGSPHKIPYKVEETTPSTSTVSMGSSVPVSFGSEISGLDEEERVEMLSREFYVTVMNEREKLQRRKGSQAFRWGDLKAESDLCHPYFKTRSVKQVRDRFKYVKKELKSLDNK